MKSEEFLREIRTAQGLERAVLKRLVVEGRRVVFHLATDVSYTQEDVDFATWVAKKYVPEGYSGEARVVKSVPSEEGVRRALLEVLASRFPAASAFLTEGDVEVALDRTGGRFFLTVGESERAYIDSDGVLDALTCHLKRNFCGSWMGELRETARELGEVDAAAPPPAEIAFAPRYFPVCEYEAIDGANPERALYIADLVKETENVTVCGRITYLEERSTKKGKPYFLITVVDGTGDPLRATYFSKKATVEKVRGLTQGESVCLTGNYEFFNDRLSFGAKSVDLGTPPKDFEPERRPSKPVPPQYRRVVPSPVNDYVQSGLFDADPLPEAFRKRRYVVFDLETTGLNTSVTGGMDRIIEIGAVKIEDGRIVEKFSSFVACPVRLSAEITELTGITDEMLVGAPPIGEVIADFYRFCDGSSLVGHNLIGFDGKFVRYYGEQEGYLFEHPQIDTVDLARRFLPNLSNHKLNTIADHFGFTFNHHRAFDDAFVTAKIFIELVRMKKMVP